MHTLFRDRVDAGHQLATRITWYLNEELPNITVSKNELIVLAIPRGSIILANIIASYLECELDILVSRKIRYELNEELAVGAVMPDGSFFISDKIARVLPISQKYLEQEIEIQKKEIARRLIEFRGTISYANKLKDKIVILVDDGIATGATIVAAAQWLKNNHFYKKLVVAVPVAPAGSEVIDRLSTIADKVIILNSPEEFSAVGQFYDSFNQVSDKEVKEIMRVYHYNI